MTLQSDIPKKTEDLPTEPKPRQQSQIDLERSEGEGMGQGRYQPEVERAAPEAAPKNEEA